MNVINTNSSALRATNAATQANKMLGTAMERLSSGKRINSAKDDAAGLAIASSMTSQIRGMNQGIRNANDGISMAQTAEGALDEVSNMMQRVRELAVQATSGTYSEQDRTNIQAEVTQLKDQMTAVLGNTEFNGSKLFNGTAGATGIVTIQAGANVEDTIDLEFSNLEGNAAITAVIGTGGTGGINLTGAATPANTVLATIDDGIELVNTTRATLGASQNRLESAVRNLANNAINLSDARSRIEDTDYSSETTALAKAQILGQASTAMLAQANQSQQNVLSLLR